MTRDFMPRPSEEPIVFTSSEEVRKMDLPPFVGYRRHLDAGIGMGRRVLEQNREYRVLLPGYPGTGKTMYPQVLAHELGFALLYLKGNSLIQNGDPNEVLRQLKKAESYLENAPLITAFDELDILAPDRAIRPLVYTIFTGAMMNMLDMKPSKTITLVMANYPLNLDMAVTGRLPYTFYFDLPDAQTLGETLEGLKVPHPLEVGKILYAKAESTNGRFVIRSLVHACNEISDRSEDPEEMAALLFPHLPQFDLRQIEEYDVLHAGYKKRSEEAIKYWERVAQEYREKDMTE